MAYVEFYRTEDEGPQTVIGRAELGGTGVVSLAGLPVKMAQDLEMYGVRDPTTRRQLYPKDGMAYLVALSKEFRGSAVTTSEVRL